MRRFSIVMIVLAFAGCKKNNAPSTHVDAGHADGGLPPAICNAGTQWAQGTQAFQDSTDEWGLDAMHLNPEGQRISVSDFDNDGWPDLIVRAVGSIPDTGPCVPGLDAGVPCVRTIWLLRNTHNHSFEDVTYSSGFLANRQTHNGNFGHPGDVVVWADVDNNGTLDAFHGCDTDAVNSDGGPTAEGETSEIMLNDGTGHFTLGPAQSDLRRTDNGDHPGGAAFTDFDLDGNIDLWVPEYDDLWAGNDVPQQNMLYESAGGGAFTNWIAQAGVVTQGWDPPSDLDSLNGGQAHTRSWSALACDLNGDGFPELMAGSYGRSPNQLWQSVPASSGVTFTSDSVASLYAYDQDYVWSDNQFADCYCQENPTDPECAGGLPAPEIVCTQPLNWDPVNGPERFQLGGNNATALCVDIDNSGVFDLVNTDIKHWWAGEGSDQAEVLVNSGMSNVTFTRPGRASMGIVVPHDNESWDEGIMTAATLDFDNDGWPDLYLGASDYPGNRGLLYHQTSRLMFESVPTAQGVDLHRSHGVVAADFDRDGDIDLVIGTSSARCSQTSYPDTDTPCYSTFNVHFFENVLGNMGNWIQLRLEGAPGTNRSAIGALVTVTAGGVTQSKQVDGGHGHFGMQDDLVQHFGLGTNCEAQVTVKWPNQKQETQTFTVPSGYRFYVMEGAEPVVDPRK